jgi:hypothetical protein
MGSIRHSIVVRLQLDYTFVSTAVRDLSGTRVFVGMVYGCGSQEP